MHREIMGFPLGKDVDHQNHNTLDNQRGNLRVASRSQNQANRSLNRSGTITNVKGVQFHQGKYEVKISVDGTDIYVGRFNHIDTARLAYMSVALLYRGEFAFSG